MSYEMNDLLNLMIESDASDLHLRVGIPPTMRIHSEIVPVEGELLNALDIEELMSSIISENDFQKIKDRGDVDFGFSYMERARFRVSALKTMGNYAMVLRQIPSKIRSMEEIGLPLSVQELLMRPRGLILVTGPTGSGKTTTLAAMINWMNMYRSGHIITIEDPVEYIFNHSKCIVTQKELGSDTFSYASALRSSMRQDPDIILIGELRDKETIEAAISAAETGHLVLASVHTTSAARTVDRLVNVFPIEFRDEVRAELASTLIGTIAQTLIKRKKGGLVAAFEIMIRTDGIASLIREGKTFQIPNDIQTGSKYGMISFDDHIKKLCDQDIINAQDAIDKAYDPLQLKRALGVT